MLGPSSSKGQGSPTSQRGWLRPEGTPQRCPWAFLGGHLLGGGLLGCQRGGGGVSWGPHLPVTFRGGCGCGLSPPLGLGLRWRACLGLGASLTLGTPLSLRGLLGSRLAGAHLSGPLDPCLTTAPTLPLGGRAGRGACGGGGIPSTGGTCRCH